ncbi:MAG: hypothetical protein AAFQ82_24125, partial [Myxococcota bacterium]
MRSPEPGKTDCRRRLRRRSTKFVLLSDDRTLTLDQSTTLASGTDGRTSWTAAAAVDDSQFYRV